MFGHLKAEEFTNLIEGLVLRPGTQAHLNTCARCREEWKALEGLRLSVASADEAAMDPSEPDWPEFRTAVRDRLLSRSVQREAAAPRSLRPAWGLGLLAAAGIIVVLFTGNPFDKPLPPAPPATSETTAPETALETERAVWSNASIFEDMAALSPEESERFRQLLENETWQSAQDDPGGK